MTVTLARFEDMSLQWWLKSVVIPLRWVEKVNNVPLVYNSQKQRFDAQVVWLPNFLEEGRGWVCFDPQGTDTCVTTGLPITEQTSRVTVYNEVGSVIGKSNYSINYLEGSITASGTTTTAQGVPTTIDFTQYYASVLDSWPGTDPPEVPIVAIDMTGYKKCGFQIGPGTLSQRMCKLHIFASSSAERDDLTEFLHDALYNRHIPVFDFRQGEPLNYDGTYNTSYSGALLTLNANDDALFYFRNISVEFFGNRQSNWSDLNRWRSTISFVMESYRQGIDFNSL